ncbi:hypothetical protein FSP39_011983 [Pinctada imbricata]|uniref:Uncharacterized protein n=1 Tax=Pinctada imbricata TaxID=66713 RepID=A0AA88XHZ0_PINIB|nr:hypothetical protein FSP39_011983 [Pinctada imbricata]
MLLASCAYLNGEYYKLFQIVNVIQKKLQREYIYLWCIFSKMDSIFSYKEQGMSDETIMKTRVLDGFRYETWKSQLLRLESEAKERNSGNDVLELPPLVFLNLLLIFSYSRLNLKDNRNKVLRDLQHLLCNDNNYHISKYRKAISWEILGICQQLCGNYDSAYQSYLKALNDQYNDFKQATIARIITLFLKIWRTRSTAFVV